MADVDTDPFSKYDKMDEQPYTDETFHPRRSYSKLGTRIQNIIWRRENSVIQTQRSYPKACAKLQKHSISTISNLGMGNCTTKERACH